MAFKDAWKSFVRTPWFRLSYIALLGILSALLFPFALGPAVCLILLVVPLTIFVVPYWFGERKARRLAENGIVVLVIAILLLGVLRTQAVLAAEPFEVASAPGVGQDATMSLRNGTVTPFRSEVPTNFTFEVLLWTTDNATPGDFAVWMNLTVVNGFSITAQGFRMVPVDPDSNTRDGTMFRNVTTLGPDVYAFGFTVQRLSTGNLTATPFILAPIAASAGTFFSVFLIFSIPLLMFTLAFYFLILFMWWWSARMRKRMTPRRVEEEGEEKGAEAGEGGKASKAAAFTCTNCGADVPEDADSCPKCGAVFEG